jgi:hypothetical protein
MVLTRVMRDFSFAVDLTALVRVRAADESVARKIVPTVVKAPNALEVRLANESNALLNSGGTVTKVDFSFKETSIKLANIDEVSGLGETDAVAPPTTPTLAIPFRPQRTRSKSPRPRGGTRRPLS